MRYTPRNAAALLKTRESWTPQQLLEHQQRTLAELRAYAYERSPFYRRFHAGLEGRPLSELPVLTKSAVMESFDDLVTEPSIRLADIEEHLATTGIGAGYLGKYTISATSGTTGQRGLFILDSGEWDLSFASSRRSSSWAKFYENLTERPRLLSFVSQAPLHLAHQTNATVVASRGSMLSLDAKMPIEDTVARLNEYQPHYIGTYPSLARPLAEAQLARRLRIAPKLVVLGGEVLTTETRRRIEAAWGKVVYMIYGATETGTIGAECAPREGLHLFDDLHIVENIDADGKPAPPGDLGARVLITVLYRRTQPLIRYEISDRVRFSARPCSCSLPFRTLDKIEGRVEEKFVFDRSDGKGSVAVDSFLFEDILDTIPAAQWQVVQGVDSLDILLVRPGQDVRDETILDAVGSELASRGARLPQLRLVRAEAIPRGPTGKASMFVPLRRSS